VPVNHSAGPLPEGVVPTLLISIINILLNNRFQKYHSQLYPRAARHTDDPNGVAELSPGLPESARATLGTKPLNPSLSRVARRAERVYPIPVPRGSRGNPSIFNDLASPIGCWMFPFPRSEFRAPPSFDVSLFFILHSSFCLSINHQPSTINYPQTPFPTPPSSPAPAPCGPSTSQNQSLPGKPTSANPSALSTPVPAPF
jgi:hypothetical protein